MKLVEKTITIMIPDEVLAYMEKWGWDFEANATQQIREAYFQMRYYEDKNKKKKK